MRFIPIQILALIGLLVWATAAHATSYGPPERRDIFSPNRQFVLDINPNTQTHSIYLASDRTTPRWSFQKPIWHEPFFLSNDGQSVISLAWRHINKDDIRSADCVYFWDANGNAKSYPFQDLCPRPARTRWVGVGPVGSFWRTWYADAYQDGDHIIVETTDHYTYSFQIKTGNIESRQWNIANLRYKPLLWTPLLLLALGFICWVTFRRRRETRNTRPRAGTDAITT